MKTPTAAEAPKLNSQEVATTGAAPLESPGLPDWHLCGGLKRHYLVVPCENDRRPPLASSAEAE
jgi:hypothetical protein